MSFEVFDGTNNQPVSHFEYAIEVIGTPPTKGTSSGSHRASVPVPVDMPFNVRIEAAGYRTCWLRQMLLRNGQQPRCCMIRLERAR